MKRTCLILFTCIAFSLAAQHSKKSAKQFTLQQADSLFLIASWKNAIPVYEGVLKANPENSLAYNRLGYCYHNLGEYDKAISSYNKSLELKPAQPLEAVVQSRLARAYAVKNDKEKAFASLDKAILAGYLNVTELQNQKEFDNLRSDNRFQEAVKRATNNAFPCMTVPKAREFDFWIGEWDVFQNGGNIVVGQSKIEVASGGCMILESWTAVGIPNTGKSMNYINTATGKWEQLWMGSDGINVNNPQKFINGEYRDGAMRFDFDQFDPQGNKQSGRFIFFNEGPNQVRQFNEISSDNGKTWTTVYDFVYKRKK